MGNMFRNVWLVARNELADSLRSRRVIVLLILYMVCAAAGTYLFSTFLQRVEHQLASAMGVTVSNSAGTVTAALWESKPFRRLIIDLVRDRELAEQLFHFSPLALFYGWLAFTFTPLLVMLTSSARVAEEVTLGSVRFAMFRVSRLHWCLGKYAGQSLQIAAALSMSAMAAWITGALTMDAFAPGTTAAGMLIFACKAWIYNCAFLGLALAISQCCSSPNVAIGWGIVSLMTMAILTGISEHYSGDGLKRAWDLVSIITPGGHKSDLWWPDSAHFISAATFLVTLGGAYLACGYIWFRRRDL